MSVIDDAYKLIGQIRCVGAEDMNDGTMKVVFDYDEKFKNEYKKLFGLKRFSKKHFERELDKAIKYFADQVKVEKGILEIHEDGLKIKEE